MTKPIEIRAPQSASDGPALIAAPGRERAITLIALAVLLLTGLGGGVYYVTKPPEMDSDSKAAKVLADLDGDLLNRRWDDAISKAESVLHSDASSNRKDVAASKKDKAETEKKNQAYYDKLIEAGGGGNYDEALLHYHEIPAESIYRQLAKEQYDKIFPLFADSHLEKAETAKGDGRCADFKAEVQKVLTEDANHLKARKLNGESCGLAIREQTPGPGRTHTPKKNDGRQTGNPVVPLRQPLENNESSQLPDEDANKILEQAQTEYVNGNFESAIKLVRQLQTTSPYGGVSSRGWRIIGAAACNLRDLKLASDAYRKLDASAREYVGYVCGRAGVVFDKRTAKLAE